MVGKCPTCPLCSRALDATCIQKCIQSCPWVGLTHVLGWVEIFFQFLVGWVGLGPLIMLMHLKRDQ